MKIPTLAGIAFAAVLLASCNSNTPDAVLTNYLEHTNSGDFLEASKYANKSSVGILQFIDGMTPADQKVDMAKQKIHVNIVSTEITGDSVARVKVSVALDGKNTPESSFKLRKEEGSWKVCLDEKMKEMKAEKNEGELTAAQTLNDSVAE